MAATEEDGLRFHDIIAFYDLGGITTSKISTNGTVFAQ